MPAGPNMSMPGTLDFLSDQIHNEAWDAGWWKGAKYENGKPTPATYAFFGAKIALIHSEVSEMLEGLRKGEMDKHLPHRPAEEVECVDAIIRLLDYAGQRGFELDKTLDEKIRFNRTRDDHKPEARNATGGKKF